MPQLNMHKSRPSTITIDYTPRKSVAFKDIREYPTTDDEDSDEEAPSGRHLNCSWIPCCMNEADAESFGHHVSIFMVALVAFATFFCVTLILILVFLLG